LKKREPRDGLQERALLSGGGGGGRSGPLLEEEKGDWYDPTKSLLEGGN